jgi:hypothetical protein
MTDPLYHERAQIGWQLLAAGVYVDQNQTMHLFPDQVLKAMGYPDTQENREMIYKVFPEALQEFYGIDIPTWITSPDGNAEKIHGD